MGSPITRCIAPAQQLFTTLKVETRVLIFPEEQLYIYIYDSYLVILLSSLSIHVIYQLIIYMYISSNSSCFCLLDMWPMSQWLHMLKYNHRNLHLYKWDNLSKSPNVTPSIKMSIYIHSFSSKKNHYSLSWVTSF